MSTSMVSVERVFSGRGSVLAIGLSVSLGLAVVGAAQAQTGSETGFDPAGFRAEAEAAIESLEMPDGFSGVVRVRQGEKILFEEAYGLASRRFGVKNRLDTKFNLGSMNKMFTAVAIAQLVERGKLRFDDLLVKHLPAYPRSEGIEAVTLHHLLTHTSGFGSYWEELFSTNFTQVRDHSEILALASAEPLAFEPGARFAYSNTGFVALGRVIEVVSGQSYFEFVGENIFVPAGMHDTESWAGDEVVENLAEGYTRSGEAGELRTNVFAHAAKGCSAGGGYSTAGDLHRFADALWGGRLVGTETLRRMHTANEVAERSTGYGYGFGVRGEGVLQSIGHNGGAPGISADFRHYPDLGVTLTVLSNVDGGARRLPRRLEALIMRLERRE